MASRFVVVGAGFSGATIAERIASMLRAEVLVVEKQRYVGGAAHDYIDAAGVVVQAHGPHIFHTNSDKVWSYVTKFGRWKNFEYRVAASIDGKLIRLPFDFDGLAEVFPGAHRTLERALQEHYGKDARVLVTEIRRRFPDVGEFVYEKIFRGYSEKHWGMPLEELPQSVTGRVPIVVGRQASYFTDKFQAIPVGGYTAIITRMLAHPRIKLSLGTDFRDLKLPEGTTVIYTGSPDEFFGEAGALPYRTVKFHVASLEAGDFGVLCPWSKPHHYATVNYPSPLDPYTRETDVTRITGAHPDGRMVVVTDFPGEHVPGKTEPLYPLPLTKHVLAAAAYEKRAPKNVWFLGRLGSYRYLNMDQAVGQALALFERLRNAVN